MTLYHTHDPADWLNPRRRLYAEAFLEWLAWNGGKVYLDWRAYADLRDDLRMYRQQADVAIDDLYALGCINLTLTHLGGIPVVYQLTTDIDGGRPRDGRGVPPRPHAPPRVPPSSNVSKLQRQRPRGRA